MTPQEGAFVVELYNKYSKKMRAQMLRQFGDAYLADDLVEEAFLTAIVRVGELMTHPDPERWLYRVLLNKSMHEYRRQKQAPAELAQLDELPDPAAGHAVGLVNMLPKGLSPHDRDLLGWRFQEQRSLLEIARHIGVTELAARKQLSRALERCRRMLLDISTQEHEDKSPNPTK